MELRGISIRCIKLFNKGAKRMAYVEFSDTASSRAIHSLFNEEEKDAHEKHIIVNWGIDASLLDETDWSAVVLRNLPPECSIARIKHNCTKCGEKVKYVTSPVCIQGTFTIS